VWVSEDDRSLAGAVERRLLALGLRPRLVSCSGLAGLPRPAALGGLLILAPATAVSDSWLRDALLGARHAGPALRQGRGAFATASRLDGAFGLAGLDPRRDPLDGGLAGLAKTAGHEWPEVACKALDLAGDLAGEVEEAARVLVEELFLVGPAEVGLTRAGRCTLERVVSPLSGPAGEAPFRPGEVVVLSGGARGVTAEVAVALAREFRITAVLLGRSPEPAPEPEWLAGLSTEADIKRALGARGEASPRVIGERYREVLAGREVRPTLARIEEVGARAVYRSVDVRDAGAVARVLAEARRTLGPVRGLVHGAGVLADARIEDKTAEQFDRVYATKVEGLRALLAAAGDELSALVLFSSSTARFGRTGQVDYAIANEVLNKLAQQQARLRPSCRVVSVNWGPWDGGMVTPGLKKVFASEGIGLIGLGAGARYLADELRSPAAGAVEVVLLAGGGQAPSAAAPPLPPPLPTAFERVLDLASYPVLRSHVFDGRPVLPTVLILEWLAHAALHQNPGLALHGCDDLRVLQGVILDGAAPAVRVSAGKAVKRDGLFVAPAELRSTRPDGREVLHARAEVVLAAELPAAPAAREVGPLPAIGLTPQEAYREGLLFHGPDLQGLEQVEGCDESGIIGAVRAAAPPAAWLRQPLRHRWLTDPLAIDGAFQLMVLWALQRRGAASLPCHVRRYRQWRRSFPAGGVRLAGTVTRATDLHALADFDFLDEEGRLVARLEGYECVIDPNLRRSFRRNQLAPAL
jgi:NAD(P)-dependent dehydrogenase (short-subunit alcohol dehydrogenase family)